MVFDARGSKYGHVTRGRGRACPVEHGDDSEHATEHGWVEIKTSLTFAL
jgi:hypothetical protein